MRPPVTIAQSEVASIAQQVYLYLLDSSASTAPAGMSLMVLTQEPDPYLRPMDLVDPWGNPYVLIAPGVVNPDFDVVSFGADGKLGGTGDNADVVN
jgi:general secretion pathway protein G